MDQCRSGVPHRSQGLVPVLTKKFSPIHNNPSVPGRGCVELGEVWGDLPFFCRFKSAFSLFGWTRSGLSTPNCHCANCLRYINFVRKKLAGWKQGHTPIEFSKPLPLAGFFFGVCRAPNPRSRWVCPDASSCCPTSGRRNLRYEDVR